jgi:hypothetical protein
MAPVRAPVHHTFHTRPVGQPFFLSGPSGILPVDLPGARRIGAESDLAAVRRPDRAGVHLRIECEAGHPLAAELQHPDVTAERVAAPEHRPPAIWRQLHAGCSLKAVPEGAGTMLDNTIVLWANHMQTGGNHNAQRLPWMIAGKGGGLLQDGPVSAHAGRPAEAAGDGPHRERDGREPAVVRAVGRLHADSRAAGGVGRQRP